MDGLGVDKDYKVSMDFYKRAADKGITQNYYRDGILFAHGGYGLDKNLTKLYSGIPKGAQIDDSESQYGLGVLYQYLFDGDKRDFKKVYTSI
jgi:TPR repeat protein